MKLLGILLFLCVTESFVGQGNLQFNQVLTFNGSLGGIAGTYTSTSQIVPVGKVWRIDHVGYAPSLFTTSTRVGININGSISLCYANGTFDHNICPIWLKQGDDLAFHFNHGSTSLTCNYVLSIVEFNIVP
jgi:hypothetical protein